MNNIFNVYLLQSSETLSCHFHPLQNSLDTVLRSLQKIKETCMIVLFHVNNFALYQPFFHRGMWDCFCKSFCLEHR